MELFYNPERMSENEIKETFVAHQWLVDEIITILKHQPKGAGVQHVVIVAPRGMGKTTILLMLRLTILNDEMAKSWQPVLFPEESYGVYDLADLWLEVLSHVAAETNDAKLHEEVSCLRVTHPASLALEEASLARIKDWRDTNKKRLLLLIDNFDMILQQIGDERDNAKLRDVLMNDGTMMLVGGATTFFKEARAYDQPLYNLFKIYNLESLDSDQIQELLRRRAKVDGLEEFDKTLRANSTRLRVLEYFTGGNPRLVLMLYRVITHSQISEVRRGLEKLLDEVTPYYKAKIETLPPQQRKVLDHIARISGRTREGLTPTEIASATRLAVNQVSAQLKRLADLGYVRSANIRGRSSYYALSEPLYAIWHQMRFGRDARRRMNWLVTFLKGWYDSEGINSESQRLQDMFSSYLNAGRLNEARDTLEHRRYLVEAIDSQSDRTTKLESIILCYLELKDIETLKSDVLTNVNISALSDETQQRLAAEGLIEEAPAAVKDKVEAEHDARTAELKDVLQLGQDALGGLRFDEALSHFRRAIDINPGSFPAQSGLVVTLANLGRTNEISAALKEAERFLPAESAPMLAFRGMRALLDNDFEGAVADLDKLDSSIAKPTWYLSGLILKQLSQFDIALKAFDYLTEMDERDFDAWYWRGDVLNDLRRHDEALESFDRALQIKPDSYEALHSRGRTLLKVDKNLDATSSFDRALEIQPKADQTWLYRGVSQAGLKNYEDAVVSFDNASKLNPDSYYALLAKITNLAVLGRNEEALEDLDTLLKLDPMSADAFYLRGLILAADGKDRDASLDNFRQAFSITGGEHQSMLSHAQALSIKLLMSLGEGDLDKAKRDWQSLKETAENEGGEARWLEIASQSLRQAAVLGNWPFVRKLIGTSDLEEPLFPLARALDYLITGDETLIEKLSPEVRGIVEEIVVTLKETRENSDVKKQQRAKRPPAKRARRKSK